MAGPAELVTDAYNDFFGFASDAFQQASAIVNDIQQFDVPLLSVNVQYTSPVASAPAFTLPSAPNDPNVNIQIGSAPTAPAVSSVAPINVGPAPTFSGSEPSLNFPSRPGPLAVPSPGAAPTLTDIVLPEEPTLLYPDAPTLREVVLPELPDVVYPEFVAELPVLDIEIPTIGITYNETPYTSLLLSETTARIRTMLQGGTGLPPDVENALFDRAKARLDITSMRAMQEVVEQWSSRGFAEPGGELSSRMREIREQNRDATNNLNRDILIRVHEVEIENLRFAVQQGVALESLLINYAAGYAQRALQAQQLMAQVAIDVFNARVNLYNAQLVGYRTQAEVFRAQIEAERSKIELYRAQIEGAAAISSLNESEVRIYAERVRALQATVDIYEAQIKAVNAQVEADQARVEAYRATVQAFGEQVNAKRAEFEAYGEEVRAQTGVVQAYEASVRAFAERTRAYQIGVEAQAISKRVEIDAARLQIEAFQAEVQGYRESVNAEVSKTQAALNLYDGQSRIFTARLGAESARVESTARQFQVEVENARNSANIALQNATSNAENALRAAQIALEALRTQATVASQLAAGALSAVNMGASISGQSSDSTDIRKSLNVSYDVDGGAGSPPAI